ncbi:MAG: helix-turn-helix domain-containing protein [Patescibacteria group bacterium]
MKKQISENLKKALLQFNLTEKEIIAYLTLLEQGNLSILDISRTSEINRVTIYSAIDELKRKGLVTESRRGKRKLFVAENPANLTNILQEKKERIVKEEKILQNIILPTLKAIDINEEKRPQIKFFEGADGINRVFDEYILKYPEAIDCGSYDTAIKAVSKKFEIKYFTQIKKRRMFFRMLLEDTPLNREFAEIGKGSVHVKFLPEETKSSADILVFGPNIALISYDRLTATLIEDKSIAESILMYLNFMWDRL